MALFRDLLKKWFYQNSSSAASSNARIPLLTATGEPKGSDTMANLASVLGGVVHIISTTEDLNSLGVGLYSTSSNQQAQTNAPFGTEAFSMVVIVFANDRTLQIAIRDTKVKYRIKWGTWKQWYEVSIF